MTQAAADPSVFATASKASITLTGAGGNLFAIVGLGAVAQAPKGSIKINRAAVDVVKFLLNTGVLLQLFGCGAVFAGALPFEICANHNHERSADGTESDVNARHVDHPNRLASRHHTHDAPATSADIPAWTAATRSGSVVNRSRISALMCPDENSHPAKI